MTAPPRSIAFKARYVFPVDSAPLAEASVVVERARIAAVGRDVAASQTIDLGNVAILPGLVNAHTHLEFSDLTEPLGELGMGFADWIRLVIDYRFGMSGESRRPVEQGLRESAAGGTTSLGEITTARWQIEQFDGALLAVTSFFEQFALLDGELDAMLRSARHHLDHAGSDRDWRAGLSPHAPYSVRPELLARVVRLAREKSVPVAMHVAESREELQILRHGEGPIRDLFAERGMWDPEAIPRGSRPLDCLKLLAQAPRSLVVHGNYLDDEEIAFAADHADRMAIVYCPRTHHFFRHDRYPLEKHLAAGALVALGTDSRASNPDLSLLNELRHVAGGDNALRADEVLRLGTINGARALGLEDEDGSLQPGKAADLTVVALPDRDARDPHELLLDSAEPVMATIRRGAVIYGSEFVTQAE